MAGPMDETRIDYARALAAASDHLRHVANRGRRDDDLATACPDRSGRVAPACYPIAALAPGGR